MKIKDIAIFSAAVCAFVSCSVEAVMAPGSDYAEGPTMAVEGMITDKEGNPINHIKVIVTCEATDDINTVYSSSKGKFYSYVRVNSPSYPIVIDIRMEDIDGEDNGGLFESLSDTITVMEDNESGNYVSATYRLTRATL